MAATEGVFPLIQLKHGAIFRNVYLAGVSHVAGIITKPPALSSLRKAAAVPGIWNRIGGMPRTGLLSLTGYALEQATSLAGRITEEIQDRKAGSLTMVKGLFLNLMTHCLRQAKLPKNANDGNFAGPVSRLVAQLNQEPGKNGRWPIWRKMRACQRQISDCISVI